MVAMPHQPVPEAKRRFARKLRRDMTDAEAKLWSELRDRRLDTIKFRRQAPIGPFVADFLCSEARLIVESTAVSTRIRSATGRATRSCGPVDSASCVSRTMM